MKDTTGALMAAARKASGMTQLDMAQALGVSTVSVSSWETGKVPMTVDKLQRWYDALPNTGQEVMRGIRLFVEA